MVDGPSDNVAGSKLSIDEYVLLTGTSGAFDNVDVVEFAIRGSMLLTGESDVTDIVDCGVLGSGGIVAG